MEEHTQCKKRRCARALFFLRRHGCMVHRKAMSSFRLGNLGARPTPQSAQLAVKESTMEEHQPKERETAVSLVARCNSSAWSANQRGWR